MKTKLLILITIFSISNSAYSQYDTSYNKTPIAEVNYEPTPVFLNFSGGFDNHAGLLGIGMTVPIYDLLAIRAGIGVGAWGLKYNAGLRLTDLSRNGWGFGLGYSYCPGIDEINLTLTDDSGNTRFVDLALLPCGSLNLSANYHWVVSDRNVFYLETGYAIKSSNSNIYRVNNNNTLTAEEEVFLEFIGPGGIIFALGFQVAL